jgi:5-methylcytosine-specific restriction enzyme subunit McrC
MIATVEQSPVDAATLANGVPIRNVWHMLVYAWKELRLLNRWQVDVESAPTLDGLFAKILGNLVRERLRIGLGRNYTSTEQLLNGLRGRVDFDRSLKRLAFQNGHAFCHFQIFSANVLKNQIIRSTLHGLAQRGDFGKNRTDASLMRHQLRRLVRDLDHIDLIELKRDVIRRQELERDDHDYRLMLAICHIILQRQMPTEIEGSTKLYGVDRDWKFLWKLFEAFVANFFALRLTDWTIVTHKTMYWPTDGGTEFLPMMKPDIVMRNKATGKLIVLDTKFSSHSLTTGQFGNLTFNRDHLFQIYAYLRSQEEKSDDHQSATGILLYPSANYHLSESTRIQGHIVRWETVDLTKPWPDIEAFLLQLGASLAESGASTAASLSK